MTSKCFNPGESAPNGVDKFGDSIVRPSFSPRRRYGVSPEEGMEMEGRGQSHLIFHPFSTAELIRKRPMDSIIAREKKECRD